MKKCTKRTADSIIAARAQKSIDKLNEHYHRGRAANEKYERYQRNDLAAELGTNSNTLRKERRFALVYDEDEFQDLIALRRPDGTALHWGHVSLLITVNDKDERKRLQKEAADGNWSEPRLRAVIRERRPPQRKKGERGGRPIVIPETTAAKLELLIKESERWLLKHKAIVESDDWKIIEVLRNGTDSSETELRCRLTDQLKEIVKLSNKIKKKLKTCE